MANERNPNFIQSIEDEKERRRRAIAHNVEQLSSQEARAVLRDESMGGNAGTVDFGPEWQAVCSALNVHVNPNTGKIISILIGNLQNLDPTLRKEAAHATFRFGDFINKKRKPSTSIEEFKEGRSHHSYILEVIDDLPVDIKDILEDSGKQYNIHIADSFRELYFAINAIGPIVSSAGKFNPEQMIALIEEVRQGRAPVETITSTYNLRNKVIELLKTNK